MISSASGASASVRSNAALMKELRATLMELQRQLGSGERAATYGGLGLDRRRALDLQGRLAAIDGYGKTIETAKLRTSLMEQSLASLSRAVEEARGLARPGSYDPNATARAPAQTAADQELKLAIDLMNADLDGRSLFSGRAADVAPVAPFDAIMNGDAAHAGLRQLIAERRAADFGVGGLGRLATPTLSGATVTLQRDAGNPGPFGFTVAGVSSNLSNVSVSGPTGALQTLSVAFAGQPASGERITVSLGLPDGSQTQLELTAALSPPTPAPDSVFAIGVDAATTAANFRTALETLARKAARTSLEAASAIVASKAFFAGSESAPPMRVPSPPESAPALSPGTAADTLIWYRGDDAATPDARASALAKIGDSQTVGVGARANEAAIAQVFAMLGAMAVVNVAPSSPDAQARYEALAERVRDGLAFPPGVQSIADIRTELAVSGAAMNAAKERHDATASLLTDSLAGVRRVDDQEVAASILSLQTRLEAAYSTTAILSRMSLTNYFD